MTVSLEAVQQALRRRFDDDVEDGRMRPDDRAAFAAMIRGLTIDGSVVRCPAGRGGAELADLGRRLIADRQLPATLRFEVAAATAADPGPGPQNARKRPRKRRSRATGTDGGTAVPGDPGKRAARMEPRDKTAEREALAVRIADDRPADVARTVRIHGRELLNGLIEAGGPDWTRIARPVGWIIEQQRAMMEPDLKRPPTADEDAALIDFARYVGALPEAVNRLPRTIKDARLATVRGLTRQLAAATPLLPAIDVQAIEVDGEPLASRSLAGIRRRGRRPKLPKIAATVHGEQLGLLPGPRTIDRQAIDPMLYAFDAIAHPTVRADVLRLARLAYALCRPLTADLATWARLLLFLPEDALLRRSRELARTTDALQGIYGLGVRLTLTDFRPVAFVDVPRPEVWAVGPPSWAMYEGPKAWRLTGGLFREGLRGQRETRAARAIDGIEAALTYTDRLIRPEGNRKTGPGPPVTIAGSDVLRLAGVDLPDLPLSDRDRKRLSRLFQTLVDRGYQARGDGEAAAGDTVEVIDRTRRAGSGTPSLIVRASARLVEARRKAESGRPGSQFERMPARRLLPPRD